MDRFSDLEAHLKRSIRRHGTPGASIAVLKGRRVVAAAAAGVTNIDTKVPVTTDAVFQIGSITKVFTATLIMQLVDDGLLSLDEPIITYLPEFQVADAATRRAVTTRHLLSHTSGIDGDFFVDSGRGDDSIARLIPMMTLLPSLFPLGAKMSYCNVGFAVLGRLVEVLRRETYDQAMRRRIFKPLGMTHAMTLPEDALRFRCAIGHVPDPMDPKRLITAPFTHLSHGQKAAGSTPAMSASDLLKFAAAHIDHGRITAGQRLLSAASAAAMQRQQIRLQKYAPTGATGWGLGWILQNLDGHKVVGHDGGTIGQYSFLRVSAQKRVAVALLTNGGDATGVYKDMFGALFADAIGRHEPELPPADPKLRIDAARYVGHYENIQSTIAIDEHRGALRGSMQPKGEFGMRLENLPIAFIDRQTALLQSGNPQLDRTALLFSGNGDDRFTYVQVGLRQYRRVG
jgi:CubicO group peptidase (beta-lactamase class C family)